MLNEINYSDANKWLGLLWCTVTTHSSSLIYTYECIFIYARAYVHTQIHILYLLLGNHRDWQGIPNTPDAFRCMRHLDTRGIPNTPGASRLPRHPDTGGISSPLIYGQWKYNIIFSIHNHVVAMHTVTLKSYDSPYMNYEINTHLFFLIQSFSKINIRYISYS